jgi:hypothetical protein
MSTYREKRDPSYQQLAAWYIFLAYVQNSHPVCPDTYKLKTACMEVNKAGTLKVSKKIWAAISRFFIGFRGASVNKTGCCKHTPLRRSEQNSLVSNRWLFLIDMFTSFTFLDRLIIEGMDMAMVMARALRVIPKKYCLHAHDRAESSLMWQ